MTRTAERAQLLQLRRQLECADSELEQVGVQVQPEWQFA